MIMARNKIVLVASLFASLAILCFVAWIGFRYMETKSSACECEDPVDNDRFAVLNPFRDRTPERVAIEVMQAFQSGRCPPFALPQDYCKNEKLDKIASWKLTGREARQDTVTIRFWVTRTRQDGVNFGDPFWVTLQHQGQSWNVTNIDTYF
jgi:hypothetical protein